MAAREHRERERGTSKLHAPGHQALARFWCEKLSALKSNLRWRVENVH
jgi:hypothetical protein